MLGHRQWRSRLRATLCGHGLVHYEGVLTMKQVMFGLGWLLSSGTLLAAQLPCADLQAQIEAKLEAKGVKDYSLEIVAKGSVSDKTVVGSCAAGTKEIVYARK
jgi:hypothetical protein